MCLMQHIWKNVHIMYALYVEAHKIFSQPSKSNQRSIFYGQLLFREIAESCFCVIYNLD